MRNELPNSAMSFCLFPVCISSKYGKLAREEKKAFFIFSSFLAEISKYNKFSLFASFSASEDSTFLRDKRVNNF